MKKRKASKSWTKKKKAAYLVGEWTKASHKRLVVDEIKKKEFAQTKNNS